jgi:hypothetical protein
MVQRISSPAYFKLIGALGFARDAENTSIDSGICGLREGDKPNTQGKDDLAFSKDDSPGKIF